MLLTKSIYLLKKKKLLDSVTEVRLDSIKNIETHIFETCGHHGQTYFQVSR